MYAVVVWLLSEICSASDALPVQSPVMASHFLLSCLLGFELSQHLMVGHGCPCSSVELQCKANHAGAFVGLRLGCVLGWSREMSQPDIWFLSALSTLLREQASICVLLLSRVQDYFKFFVRQLIDLHFFRVNCHSFISFLWWCHVSLIIYDPCGLMLVSVHLKK